MFGPICDPTPHAMDALVKGHHVAPQAPEAVIDACASGGTSLEDLCSHVLRTAQADG